MTRETEDTESRVSKNIAGGQGGQGGQGGPTKPPPSSTALSTIGIQAGRSQLLISVLKKHEDEVLSLVENKRQTARRRKDGGMMERMRSRKEEEEEKEVSRAMEESLKEAWLLLLRLLHRRQEVLILAADFYQRALEFSVSIQQVENLQINKKLTEVKLIYDSMRRDVLGKSLQVLNSSSVLLEKLKQLQWTEALQRRGGVLQEDDQEENQEESPQRSRSCRGAALKLEELVELLQDRRRRADHGFRLQLQQVEDDIRVHENQSEDWSLILDQDQRSGSDLQPESGHVSRDLQSESRSAETEELDLKSRFRPWRTIDLPPKSTSEESEPLQTGSRLDLNLTSKFKLRSNLNLKSGLEQTRDLKAGSGSDLNQNSSTEEDPDLQTGTRSETKGEELRSGSEKTKDLQSVFTSHKIKLIRSGSDLRSESRLKTGSSPDLSPESRILQSESTSDFQSGSRSEETGSGSDLDLNSKFRPGSGLKTKSGLELTRDLKPVSQDLPPGSRSEETRVFKPGSRSVSKVLQSGSGLDLKTGSRSNENKNQQSGFSPLETMNLPPESRSDLQPGCGLDLNQNPTTEEDTDLQTGTISEPQGVSEDTRDSVSEVDPRSRSEQIQDLQSGSRSCSDMQPRSGPRSEDLVQEQRESPSSSSPTLQSMLGMNWPSEEGSAHPTLLTNQRQQFEGIMDKVCTGLQQSTSVLISLSSEPRPQLSEAEDALNTNLALYAQAEVLTEQLKRGSSGTRTSSSQTGPSGCLGLVVEELQNVKGRVESNLVLLQPYVRFLRAAQQVEEELEELREIYRSPQKKKEEDVCWQETLQRLDAAQELGNSCIQAVTVGSGSGLGSVSVVHQTLQRLEATKQDLEDLRHQHQIQIQIFRKHQEKLQKTRQNLKCVLELLDSCTLTDLGSDVQTSRLMERFSRARPHFTQLDAEVEQTMRSWKSLRGGQDQLEKEVEEVVEEDLSELLKLQQRVKHKIQESESILDLTSSFHLTTKRLEALLQSEPSSLLSGLSGSGEAELSQQIQNLFEAAAALKSDICVAVTQTSWTSFRTEQLEVRLLSLDSLRLSWLNKAARREEKLCRDRLTQRLHDNINQLRDSFKELKKRFNNLKFNFLKRNERSRNMKAVRNQLQQVEMLEEKLQGLRERVQTVTGRLGSEVRDGAVAREMEDAVNELQRQMGELKRSIDDHRRTLDTSLRLQRAMDEYHLWWDDAAATIARVGKFSSECRSSAAVSVLYQQFEKFVWPTVPEQEERISQIRELAARLHGPEEGRCLVEKTTVKHSEMVASIIELSHGLMELEKKLKMESLEQNDEEEEKKEEMKEKKEEKEEMKEKKEEMKQKKEEKEELKEEKEEMKQKEKKKKEELKEEKEEMKQKEEKKEEMKQKEDNRSSQDVADMNELKETGHTPELTAMHHGKYVSDKRLTAANRKPPFQSRFTSSCSPVEVNRGVHSHAQPVAIDSQATPHSPVIGPSFSDIQREFQNTSAGMLPEAELMEDCLSNDEYECPSPDDISLPPLAETPESNMVQSDEDVSCFSSHSHQGHVPAELTGTGGVQQHRQASHMEVYLAPPNRIRSESSSFAQSPLTVPGPSLPTSPLCSVLAFRDTNTVHSPQAVSLQASLASGSNSVHESNKQKNVFKGWSSLQITHSIASKSETLPLPCPTGNCPLSSHNTRQQDTKTSLHQDLNPSQTRKETDSQTSAGTVTQRPPADAHHTTYSAPESPLSHSEAGTVISPVPKDSCPQSPTPMDHLYKGQTRPQDTGLLKSSTTVPRDNNTYLDSRGGLDQNRPSSQSSEEASSGSTAQSLSTTTPPTHKQTSYCQSRAPQRPSSQEKRDFLHVHLLPPISTCTHQTICSLHYSSTSASTQQCVHNSSMTPSSPAPHSPPPPAPSGAQTQALAQQANLHVSPPSPPPHLLTPHQHPDICQPVSIREEIKLTPQIQGLPLPPPAPPAPPAPPLAQAESLPQGKASKAGHPCFTRPWSRATVMEGSPVTLELEVTGHPEPRLSWSEDGESRDGRLSPHQDPEREAGDHDGGGGGGGDDGWLLVEVLDTIREDWQTWFGSLCALLWLLYLIIL
ncbi:golgin subfamily B member 1-like isoform X2 [Mugil cephalus]|uniref:golgin subfamily B member 1-like isoform X2 n=1 Tax=Mugil cephalus TaxID=48193 RepID=UPI001FB63F19|nr:golgin subfamily B member 1-like isoform X2 [Mugil cephalus]